MNTIRVFEANHIRVAHMGDIGCMPDLSLLHMLQDLDTLIVPVGGCYTIDAKQARELANVLTPRVVIPMHYRFGKFGFPEIATLDDFLALSTDIQYYESNSIVIDDMNQRQTAILQYRGGQC